MQIASLAALLRGQSTKKGGSEDKQEEGETVDDDSIAFLIQNEA
jgi:hypothetical protein